MKMKNRIKRFNSLRREARRSAREFGHNLDDFEKEGEFYYKSRCQKCYKEILLDLCNNSISGEAYNKPCEVESPKPQFWGLSYN